MHTILLLIAAVTAGTPVVLEGEDQEVAAREIAARTGLPVDQLAPVEISSLLAQPPQVVGDAVLRRCVREPAEMEQVRAELARADAARRTGDSVAALDHLDLAVASLGCLSELVEPSVASQVFLLRGAVLAASGDLGAARAELRTALSFEHALPWKDGLPEEGRALLEEERSRSALHKVTAMPSRLVSGPWLGGRPLQEQGLHVADGLLLAQYSSPAGVRSAWMVVSGDTVLLIPSAYRQPVLEQMASADRRREVELLLKAALPEFTAAYVHHSSWGTWLVADEGGSLSTSEIIPPEPPKEPPPPKRRWWQRR